MPFIAAQAVGAVLAMSIVRFLTPNPRAIEPTPENLISKAPEKK
jgi:hypothetical protein